MLGFQMVNKAWHIGQQAFVETIIISVHIYLTEEGIHRLYMYPKWLNKQIRY